MFKMTKKISACDYYEYRRGILTLVVLVRYSRGETEAIDYWRDRRDCCGMVARRYGYLPGRKTNLDSVVGSVFNGVVFFDPGVPLLDYQYAAIPSLGLPFDCGWDEFDRDL